MHKLIAHIYAANMDTCHQSKETILLLNKSIIGQIPLQYSLLRLLVAALFGKNMV